jgi:hypothetical protein
MAQTDETAFMRAIESFDMTGREAISSKEDLCGVYRKVKPILEGILPFIELIPVWGKRAASAIRLLMKGLDALCPA